MVEVPRSSFIPKESMGMTPNRVRRGRTFHVFGFLGTALLVGSILGAGLVFFLKGAAVSSLETAKQELSAQKSLFDDGRVEEVKEFDRRLEAAEVLLKNHSSPLRIFTALEGKTKKKIQFTSFTLERTSMSEVLVSLSGRTDAFKVLALQEMGFADDALLKDIIFSEVATFDGAEEVGTEGSPVDRGITFTLTGSVDTELIRYDGTSYNALSATSFTEDGGTLVAVGQEEREAGVVLGESITNE